MRHGGWRNESCAKGYIEDSLAYKARTGEIFQTSIIGPVASNNLPACTTNTTPSKVASIASVDSYFDTSFDDNELADVVDRASQQVSNVPVFDTSIDESELVNIVNEASQRFEEEHRSVTSTNQNSFLNAVMSRSFKSVNFGKMENCTFNFYLGNGPTQ